MNSLTKVVPLNFTSLITDEDEIRKIEAQTKEFEDVDMDEYVSEKDSKGLKTSGVGPCFAIGMEGYTKEGHKVLALGHTSHRVKITDFFDNMIKLMNKNENILEKAKIRIYVAGGMPKIEGVSNVEDEINEVLELKAKRIYNIIVTDFNIVQSEDDGALTAVLTPSDSKPFVCYKKKSTFDFASIKSKDKPKDEAKKDESKMMEVDSHVTLLDDE